jgi:DNA polymerase-3 subunit delta'
MWQSKRENNGANQSCNLKFQKYHIPITLCLPYRNYRRSKEKTKSIDFITDWRQFIIKSPYGGLFDWYAILGVQNKQNQSG